MLSFANVNAEEDAYSLSAGAGVDYGGLGVKFARKFEAVELFASTGLFARSSIYGKTWGWGVGVDYFIDEQCAITIYSGVLNAEHSVNDDFKRDNKANIGLSVGYKYLFNNQGESGFSVGVNYNIYKGDDYPSLSVGYRF